MAMRKRSHVFTSTCFQDGGEETVSRIHVDMLPGWRLGNGLTYSRRHASRMAVRKRSHVFT
ncbi:hypothetical protein DPMN_100279 [Dreissena polymorpha]|uniref:Uncharacterized protein n=1 Tax=Dreissena polymorpha TaxID=45954 RepID=A0A9D4R826_DREPO|nr:hypothetical protein DPMN_100279 [Dreissena polymorpha]